MTSYSNVLTSQKNNLQGRLTYRQAAQPGGAFSLEDILRTFPHLPSHTAVLGLCRDGLPVLFDLLDERPGSLLVCADQGAGKVDLLQAIFLSTLALSSPRDVQFVVLSSDPARWDWLANARGAERYLLALEDSGERGAAEWIQKLAGIVDARRAGRQNGPVIMLLIDEVQFLSGEDLTTRRAFDWLLRQGAPQGIWTVASTQPPSEEVDAALAQQFHTLIVGHTQQPGRLGGLLGPDVPALPNLLPGKEFTVRVHQDWVLFQLPDLR